MRVQYLLAAPEIGRADAQALAHPDGPIRLVGTAVRNITLMRILKRCEYIPLRYY
jgi:hypothetical protein